MYLSVEKADFIYLSTLAAKGSRANQPAATSKEQTQVPETIPTIDEGGKTSSAESDSDSAFVPKYTKKQGGPGNGYGAGEICQVLHNHSSG